MTRSSTSFGVLADDDEGEGLVDLTCCVDEGSAVLVARLDVVVVVVVVIVSAVARLVSAIAAAVGSVSM